jgi:hypothetical protein
VRVLKWFTAAEGVEEPLFTVTRDGEPVAYLGAHYKRPTATGKDYISLKAGKSISYTVNLAEYYDLSQSGQYEVAYAVAAYNLFDEKGNSYQSRDSLVSGPVSMKVEDAHPKANRPSLRLLRRAAIHSMPVLWTSKTCLCLPATRQRPTPMNPAII